MNDVLQTLSLALELLAYAIAVCAALAAALPKSQAPWRKFLDTLALNLGNAKNDVSTVTQAVQAVQAIKPPKAAVRWQDKIHK